MRKSVHSAGQRVLCDLLRDARHKAELTQQKLAQKLAKPQSFVAKYENGERRLDVVEFVQVVRAIGADPGRLMKALLRRM
jgi:transcriptional regulator with XRE-family HTH domain